MMRLKIDQVHKPKHIRTMKWLRKLLHRRTTPVSPIPSTKLLSEQGHTEQVVHLCIWKTTNVPTTDLEWFGFGLWRELLISRIPRPNRCKTTKIRRNLPLDRTTKCIEHFLDQPIRRLSPCRYIRPNRLRFDWIASDQRWLHWVAKIQPNSQQSNVIAPCWWIRYPAGKDNRINVIRTGTWL